MEEVYDFLCMMEGECIFQFLNVRDVVVMRGVSILLEKKISDTHLWMMMYERDFHRQFPRNIDPKFALTEYIDEFFQTRIFPCFPSVLTILSRDINTNLLLETFTEFERNLHSNKLMLDSMKFDSNRFNIMFDMEQKHMKGRFNYQPQKDSTGRAIETVEIHISCTCPFITISKSTISNMSPDGVHHLSALNFLKRLKNFVCRLGLGKFTPTHTVIDYSDSRLHFTNKDSLSLSFDDCLNGKAFVIKFQ